VAIAESLIFLITLVGIINRKNLVSEIKVSQVNFTMFKKMAPYSLMAVFSAVLLPFVAIAIRTHIIENIGYKDAGFWEAMTRISNYYLMFVSSIIALYLLPRFAEIEGAKAVKREIISFYKTIIPFLFGGLVLIYIFKHYIVIGVFCNCSFCELPYVLWYYFAHFWKFSFWRSKRKIATCFLLIDLA